MSDNVRISDLVRPFDGEGDIVKWLDKLKLVAELKGIAEGGLAKTIPLFLEGSAYDMYTELSATEKASEEAIKKKLIKAFGVNRYVAYEMFSRRVWKEGEPVDVFITDLRKLSRLAGMEGEEAIRCAFVVGLPTAVSRELRASSSVDEMTLPQLLDRARALMAELHVGERSVVAVSAAPSARKLEREAEPRPAKEAEARAGRVMWCFRCGGPHMIRNCPTKPKFECWTCGKEGHSARVCDQGNGRGGAAVQAAAAPLNRD